jgi:pimeloyl-ACP methyl ester carboxylesterase
VPELAITVDVDVEGGLVEQDQIHADLDQNQPRHLCKRRRACCTLGGRAAARRLWDQGSAGAVKTWVPPRFEERCADPLFDRSGAVSTPSWGRFTAEYLALFRDFRQFRAGNRKGVFACGDGHPVIVLPGFLCCDPMTSHFRRLLEGLGYPAAGWGAGINLGPTAASLSAVEALLQQITDRYGERASLVGQSLGGVFARSLASHHPTRIRRVITVCSPFRLPTATRLEPIYRLVSPLHHGQVPYCAVLLRLRRFRQPRSIPLQTASSHGPAASTSPGRAARTSRSPAPIRRCWKTPRPSGSLPIGSLGRQTRASPRPQRHIDVFPVGDGAGWTHDRGAPNSLTAASTDAARAT